VKPTDGPDVREPALPGRAAGVVGAAFALLAAHGAFRPQGSGTLMLALLGGLGAALIVASALGRRVPDGLLVGATVGASLVAGLAALARHGLEGPGPPLLVLHGVVVGLLAPRAAPAAVGIGVVLLVSALIDGSARPLAGGATEAALVATSTVAVAVALLLSGRRQDGAGAGCARGLLPATSARAEGAEPARDEAPPSAARRALADSEAREEGDAIYRQVLERATDAILLEDHERQQAINALVETSRDWIWAVDLDGRVTFSNAAVRGILGYEPEELYGTAILEHVHPEERAAARERLRAQTAQRRGWKNQLTRWLHRDGQIRYLESSAVPIVSIDDRLVGFRGVDRDVTERVAAEEERRRLEEQIVQGQKLEAIGALAGGVAHDFNNLLQIIVTMTSMAKDREPGDTGIATDLEQIEAAAMQAAELTRQLLAFSRQQVLERRVVSVNRLARDLLGMVRRVIGEDVTLTFVPGEGRVSVLADPGQLAQVLLNLCVNARDALPRGGHIRVATEEVELGAGFCVAHPGVGPGRYAKLSVTDDGAGMDAETQRRIFEPFFTTKELGKGTGLGLATVYGIVRQHDGAVEVTSALGAGTTLSVYFPISDAAPVEESPGAPLSAPRGTETILLAEDDELVRALAVRLIGAEGYRLLVAEDGAAAVELLREHGDEIDLLLLDVVMPKLSGPEVEERAATLAPRARVLFMTGYAALERHDRFESERPFSVIAKPYTRTALLRKIREVLDAR